MEVEPITNQSADRLKQFCDQMGVTDRYTGYRHNLNRGSRTPVRLGYSWLDGRAAEQSFDSSNAGRSTQSFHKFKEPTRLVNYSAPTETRRRETHALSRSIQERCGINTRFPGDTEYMIRYVKPEVGNFKQGYIINPLPNYSSTGRPMALHLYERNNSEYQHRYTFPDGSTITKFPWLRK